MYKQGLALNNLQGLYAIKHNQPTNQPTNQINDSERKFFVTYFFPNY